MAASARASGMAASVAGSSVVVPGMVGLLEACPQLTESQARDQWNALRRRAWLSRQEPFLPVETLLSYGLFFLLDPHRFGGGNIDRVPPEVKVLAAKRPESHGLIPS